MTAARFEDRPRVDFHVYRSSRPKPDVKLTLEQSSAFMALARYTCELCGMRSAERIHPPDEETGLPGCVARQAKERG